jgi:hypothetical protein
MKLKDYMDLIQEMEYYEVDRDIAEKVKNLAIEKDNVEKAFDKILLYTQQTKRIALDGLEVETPKVVGKDGYHSSNWHLKAQIAEENQHTLLKIIAKYQKAFQIIKDYANEILEIDVNKIEE